MQYYESTKKTMAEWLDRGDNTQVVFLSSVLVWSLLLTLTVSIMVFLGGDPSDRTGLVLFAIFFFLPSLWGGTSLLMMASRWSTLAEQKRLEAERGRPVCGVDVENI